LNLSKSEFADFVITLKLMDFLPKPVKYKKTQK
jgi:hypothetical protein